MLHKSHPESCMSEGVKKKKKKAANVCRCLDRIYTTRCTSFFPLRLVRTVTFIVCSKKLTWAFICLGTWDQQLVHCCEELGKQIGSSERGCMWQPAFLNLPFSSFLPWYIFCLMRELLNLCLSGGLSWQRSGGVAAAANLQEAGQFLAAPLNSQGCRNRGS